VRRLPALITVLGFIFASCGRGTSRPGKMEAAKKSALLNRQAPAGWSRPSQAAIAAISILIGDFSPVLLKRVRKTGGDTGQSSHPFLDTNIKEFKKSKPNRIRRCLSTKVSWYFNRRVEDALFTGSEEVAW